MTEKTPEETPKKAAPKRKPAARKPAAKKPAAKTVEAAPVVDTGVTPVVPIGEVPEKPKPSSAPKAEVSPPPQFTLYVSVEREPVSFNFGPVPSMRYQDGRLAWRVPTEKVDAFDRHHWVQIGRIKRAEPPTL